MLLVGSRALVLNNPEIAETRKCVDWDFIATIEQFTAWHKATKGNLRFAVPTDGGKYYHCRDKDGMNYEFEIAWPGTSAETFLIEYNAMNLGVTVTASNHDLLLIKESHKYKRNSPHFLKTMSDIKFLRGKLNGGEPVEWIERNREILKAREAETYTYAHPKLDVTSKDFFTGDGVDYVYDHDDLHIVLAVDGEPAYKSYMRDNSEVMIDMNKFFQIDQRTRLLGGLEESLVLSCERSLIPYNFEPDADAMFKFALQKVCTSITSGRFRSFCWEHYNEIVDLYYEVGGSTYVDKIKSAIENGGLVGKNE
jgi:hypothetical protein